MKLLTLGFLTCARKSCRANPAAFPLQPHQVALEEIESAFNGALLAAVLARIEWSALVSLCDALGLPGMVAQMPQPEELWEDDGDDDETGRFEARGGQEARAAATGEDADVQMGDASVPPPPPQPSPQLLDGHSSNSSSSSRDEGGRRASRLARDLHHLLLETTIQEGQLVCRNCAHQYAVKEGIANFLLPAHLV